MKTYKDFNMELYKKTVVEMFEESGMKVTEDSIDRVFNSMTNPDGEVEKVGVCCLTCGIKFPINRLEHDCEEEDVWLYQYILSSVNKDIPFGYLEKLKQKYPLKNTSETVFRGINFETKELYDDFMEQYNNGTLTFSTLTSWSKVYKQAWSFARFIKKGTRKNEDERKKALEEMVENKAFITGYKGIVITTEIKEGDIICDISENGIGGKAEYEVLLSSGTYSVEILVELEQLSGLIPWKISEIELGELLLN